MGSGVQGLVSLGVGYTACRGARGLAWRATATHTSEGRVFKDCHYSVRFLSVLPAGVWVGLQVR